MPEDRRLLVKSLHVHWNLGAGVQCLYLSHGFPQGGAGAAGVPQVAQDHCKRRHVANIAPDAAGQRRGRLAAAAQPRLAPSHPGPGEVLACSCHCCRAAAPWRVMAPETAALRCDDDRDQAMQPMSRNRGAPVVQTSRVRWRLWRLQQPSCSTCSCAQEAQTLSTLRSWYDKCSCVTSRCLLEA
jgi:hypothetical protein